MDVKLRKQCGLIGVEWGSDFGVVDLTGERLIMYGFSKSRPNVSWYIPTVTLKDADFEVLLTEKENKEVEGKPVGRDELVLEYANWGEVVALLLHPDYKFCPRIKL